MSSNCLPPRRGPVRRTRRRTTRWPLAVLGCAAGVVIMAGCTSFLQAPGDNNAGSAGTSAPQTAALVTATPRHAPDDVTQTLPNPNALVSAPTDRWASSAATPRIATQFIYRTDLPQETAWGPWTQTPITSWDADVQPAVRFLHDTTGFGASTYPGHDPTMGRAADFRPTSAAAGTRLANWLTANTGPLGIQYIVWSDQIYDTAWPSGGVRYLADRGSVTQNHQDHVHVSFRTLAPISVNTGAVRPAWGAATDDGSIPPYGAIGAKWAALGGASGFLGKPLNSEYNVTGVAGARMEDFAGGSIYWSAATGAHEVHGGILARYQASGNAANYGLPVTDESKTPDGIGRYNHFTGGRSIYWTPSTHAHLVYGAIRVRWAALGWERGSLGYPTTDEYAVTGGRRSDFQHGSITWSSQTGVLTVTYR